MLARKWRPKGFDDVVGQEHVTRTLKNAIEAGRVAHAYLFVGPRGIGKTSLARIFAKALDCEKGPTTAPCSACSMCREIAAGNALDVLEIDGASNNGVDQVRDLRDQVQFAPTHGTFKIIIIDEVHMLSTAAFNALLKTLEEPPPHVKFIFATTEGDKVLPTIISRCQRFDLRRIQTPLIVERLRHICTAEHITIDDDALLAVARGAEGGMRDALSALDQLISFKGDALTEEDVLAVFGLVSRRSLEGLATAVLKGDMPEILRLVAMFDSAGKDMRRLTVELMESFRNLLNYQYVGEAMSTLDATPEQVRTLAEQASLADASRVQQIADQLAEMEGRLRFALSVRTLIEMTLIRCARIANAVSLEEVLRRLNALRSDEPPAVASKPAAPAARPADLYDDPVLKQVLQEFDGKIVGVEDGDD
ncbi:MAG TPA: DNA polymerase III subunit gamma/tau [Kiritimatiellia bacterium]|nr:DNA polymerase III subunit gamma/tau [Kiritimatiellia bacterium]